ncbi:MAG TPA: bS18 family ribosomal protein, partial [bacterium]|nr:bS18 family ribosomal protein [bacterium]
TGTCASHQRMLTLAIKRARFIGLLSYIRKP